MNTADLAERFLGALTTRDVDQVMPLWNEDGVMDFPFVPEGSPNTFKGVEAIRTTLASACVQRPKMGFFDVRRIRPPTRTSPLLSSRAT